MSAADDRPALDWLALDWPDLDWPSLAVGRDSDVSAPSERDDRRNADDDEALCRAVRESGIGRQAITRAAMMRTTRMRVAITAQMPCAWLPEGRALKSVDAGATGGRSGWP